MALDYSQDIYYLGSRIRDERVSRGMSQEDLAEAMDMAVSTLYRIENGKTSVPIAALLCAAEVLQVSVSDLLPPRFERRSSGLERDYQKLDSKSRRVVYDTITTMVRGLLAN